MSLLGGNEAPLPGGESRDQVESLDFHPHSAVMRCPCPATRDGVRGGLVETQDVHHCHVSPRSCGVGEATWGPVTRHSYHLFQSGRC